MAHRILLRKIHTERRTPTPANTTLAGENTCQINMRVQISDQVRLMRHTIQQRLQAAWKEQRERSLLDLAIVSIDHCYFVIDLVPGFVLKNGENGVGSVARLELDGERVCK